MKQVAETRYSGDHWGHLVISKPSKEGGGTNISRIHGTLFSALSGWLFCFTRRDHGCGYVVTGCLLTCGAMTVQPTD